MRLPSLLALLCALSASTISAIPRHQDLQFPLGSGADGTVHDVAALMPDPLDDLKVALDTLQTTFFDLPTGTWPAAIDWTSAVIGTFLAAGVSTLTVPDYNLSNRYFAQLVAFWYGQNVEALRGQAYDDMLWVVLNWLEAVKMIDHRVEVFENNGTWTGEEWKDTWALRSREFYEIAEQGWDTTLCNGGMLWSPTGLPYKNAITNELFISASISMYLYYPASVSIGGTHLADGRNQTYLNNALKGYAWLKGSHMMDKQGLYTDGFHISSLDDANVTDKTCDQRNEMVYTYNQGVLLSGLRGLAEATGNTSFLDEGHALINSLLTSEGTVGQLVVGDILTEMCDPSSTCSQDGQNFKGIFMHHLTLFCAALPKTGAIGLPGFSTESQSVHAAACARYDAWIVYNTFRAWRTRNDAGLIGSWWASPAGQKVVPPDACIPDFLPPGAVDYINKCPAGQKCGDAPAAKAGSDLNDRGRGRTVESHAGGLSAVRAVVEVVLRD